MSSCGQKLKVIRGDTFMLDVGLSKQWEEVIADPAGYRGRLVFREEQDDFLPSLLTLEAVPELTDEPVLNQAPVYMAFTATAGETQQLPEYDVVAYCEIFDIDVSPEQPTRLFDAKVDIND